LQIGAVIKMNRSAGDNMRVLLHDLLIGYGEIVVIETKMGIRITDVRQE
jgi:flagellar motor switch/type III secretory pathway protein FliN